MEQLETLVIRRADQNDAFSLLALNDQLEMAASSRPCVPRPQEERLPYIVDALNSERSAILVAVLGSTVVGYVHTTIFPNIKGRSEGKIVEIVVDENERGQGIGTGLFGAAIANFDAAGVEVFEVTTGENNAAAQKFYAKQGLVVDEVAFRGRLPKR